MATARRATRCEGSAGSRCQTRRSDENSRDRPHPHLQSQGLPPLRGYRGNSAPRRPIAQAHLPQRQKSRHNSDMEITWLGHGTFRFRLASGQVIVMDPWIEGNPAYPQGFKIPRVDTICISHGHFDHIHDAVPLATRFSPEAVAIFETASWLESKGVKNTRAMNKGG